MGVENVYIALILNSANIGNFSSYNDVIILFNSMYPNNKLVIEKYLVDGSTTQTYIALDNFINKYPSGKRVSVSISSTILIASSNYFIKNNLDILSISISASSNSIKTTPNVLTYGYLNQYAVINDFMIYQDYQMKQIQVLYQQNTTNDVFFKDTLEIIKYQSNLLNINVSVSFLEKGKYDYNIKSKTMVIILGNTKDITNIFGNVPAIAQLFTNINYTTVSKSVYDSVKNNPDSLNQMIFTKANLLF